MCYYFFFLAELGPLDNLSILEFIVLVTTFLLASSDILMVPIMNCLSPLLYSLLDELFLVDNYYYLVVKTEDTLGILLFFKIPWLEPLPKNLLVPKSRDPFITETKCF